MNHIKDNTFVNCNCEDMHTRSPLEQAIWERNKFQDELGDWHATFPNRDAQQIVKLIKSLNDERTSLTKERDEWKSKAEIAAKNFSYIALKEDRPLLDRIHSLEEGVRCAVDALQELHDWQNGPPLVTYEAGWTAAMIKAERAISTLKPLINGGSK